jgi:hypothetical protein
MSWSRTKSEPAFVQTPLSFRSFAPSSIPIECHSIVLELRLRDLRQADRARASFRKKSLRSVDVFAQGFPKKI